MQSEENPRPLPFLLCANISLQRTTPGLKVLISLTSHSKTNVRKPYLRKLSWRWWWHAFRPAGKQQYQPHMRLTTTRPSYVAM